MTPQFETKSRIINNIQGNPNETVKEKMKMFFMAFMIFMSKALHFNEFSACFI